MVDINLVAAKLRELAERIARVRMHCPAEASDLEGYAGSIQASFTMPQRTASPISMSSRGR